MKKVPCEIWSRVVGYYQMTRQWNPGKREEFSERKMYNLKGGFEERLSTLTDTPNKKENL